LLNGIRIGDRHYQFLAFGNSQFRENGAYFFCPTEDLTCADIRHWMGDFTSIKMVAKYAARLGLCFSTTRAIRSNKTTIKRIEDVERNGYCFTDGVGKISDSLALMIANQLNLPLSNPVPSAFQFRLGGGKGMLVNWPDMSGEEIHIRKSQWKFEARYDGLEIIRCSRFSPATLNRQTITILSSLGVRDEVFNKMLSEQLQNYQAAMTDKNLALDLLSRYIDDNHMTTVIASMVLDGFMEVSYFVSTVCVGRAIANGEI
jgi:RNA-dependent RNA polymerase